MLFGDNINIEASLPLCMVQPEKFAPQPLDPIPDDRIAHLAGNSHSQPPAPGRAGLHKGDKIDVLNFFPRFRQP